MNHELSHAFSRKTDGTELQKPQKRKFFYSFIYNDLRHFPRKKSPEFRPKAQVRLNMKGVVLPLRTYDVACKGPRDELKTLYNKHLQKQKGLRTAKTKKFI